MALINTDWTKELEQVNESVSKLLEEKVEPMIERQRKLAVRDLRNLIILLFGGLTVVMILFFIIAKIF